MACARRKVTQPPGLKAPNRGGTLYSEGEGEGIIQVDCAAGVGSLVLEAPEQPRRAETATAITLRANEIDLTDGGVGNSRCRFSDRPHPVRFSALSIVAYAFPLCCLRQASPTIDLVSNRAIPCPTILRYALTFHRRDPPGSEERATTISKHPKLLCRSMKLHGKPRPPRTASACSSRCTTPPPSRLCR